MRVLPHRYKGGYIHPRFFYLFKKKGDRFSNLFTRARVELAMKLNTETK